MRKKDLKASCIGKGGMFGDKDLFENRDYCFLCKMNVKETPSRFFDIVKNQRDIFN